MKNNKQKKNVLCPMDIINTDINTTDINGMVADYAKVKFGKLNLAQFKPQKELAAKHKNVCISVQEFHAAHPEMPLYAILSCGVSSGAYKRETFKKGYKKFDAKKCKTVLQMAKEYNKAMGINSKPTDVTYRLCAHFYTNVSSNIEIFRERLSKGEKMDGKRGNYQDLCANLGM